MRPRTGRVSGGGPQGAGGGRVAAGRRHLRGGTAAWCGGRRMSARLLETRPGVYRDSVRLMQISQALRGVPGVSGALVAMATELNLDLAAGMGFPPPDGSGPNDLLVAIAAADDGALAAARDRLDAELRAKPAAPASGTAEAPPRTVGAAVRRSGAGLVLVSTPGRYAFLDALDALDAGANVLVFSDNVPVDDEVRLKDTEIGRAHV